MQKLYDEILEPAKAYPYIADTFSKNVDEYFYDLSQKSNVDIAANKETCKVIYAKEAQVEKLVRKNKGNKVGKVFAAIFAAIGYLLMVIGIVWLILSSINKSGTLPILAIAFIPAGLVVGLSMTLIICLVINKKIKQMDGIIHKLNDEIKVKKDEAWNQMEGLNKLFTWNMPQHLISETLPLIKLDRVFEPKRFIQLVNEYDYNPDNSTDESIVCVQSGQIEGNPFLFLKTYYTYMGMKVYTGSITISWTTTYTDSNGTHTQHHTQVLTASLSKPYPYYDYRTDLIYGNAGAPNLTFMRQCNNVDASKMSERQLSKYVMKQGKRLDKQAEKTVKKGGSYTKLGNDEFEALFNCTNMNNAVEYRVMFTPLGQKNMVALLKSKPYGDDFDFIKDRKINIIHSKHSQNFEYHAAPWLFQSFDYEEIEAFFKSYCNEYMQSIYFDIAPLISIPEYVLNKSKEYFDSGKSHYNLTYHEIESLCNYYGVGKFAHPKSATGAILKCQYANKQGPIDNAVIHAYSYEAIQRTTLVPVYGGDGHTHNVPVIWYEYLPLEQSTQVNAMDVQAYNEAKQKSKDKNNKKDIEFDSVYSQKGLSLSM